MGPPPTTRERRLWIATALTLTAIYASIPFAGSLAASLRASGLLAPAFAALFVLAIAVTIGWSVRRASGPRPLWVALAVATVWGMLFVRLGVSAEERGHLFEYGLLALLVHELLRERRKIDRGGAAHPAVLAVLATAAFGWVDEAIQGVVPGRVYDLRDVGVNALAGVVAVASSVALRWATGRRERGTPRA
ncbi:MAG: VanZ family protein [Gemmatimonadetes bacterium]|nr:VanZ family protein [Gemmatimonadota bacterium]